MENLKNYFKNISINKILDIATGKGQFIKVLLDIFPDASFTGIDPNEESLNLAKESFQNNNIRFLQMGAEKLNFEDNTFNLVSISNGLHHLPQLETSIVISELVSDNLSPAQENQKFYHHLKSYTDRITGNFHHETWKKQEILDMTRKNSIQTELVFDYFDGKDFITETEDVDFWIIRLKGHIDTLKGQPVYQELLPKIDEFRKRIEKDGMEHADNVVIVGKG